MQNAKHAQELGDPLSAFLSVLCALVSSWVVQSADGMRRNEPRPAHACLAGEECVEKLLELRENRAS